MKSLAYEYKISYTNIQLWFKEMGIYTSCLLEPIAEIERLLKSRQHLTEDEHLIRFDTNDECFVVGKWATDEKKLTLKEKLKLWLLRK